jgi:hypothetical protein
LRRAKIGIHFVDHLDGDGAQAFAQACRMGLEGIVSKDRTRSYRSGRSKTWLKIKNPQAPGVTRFEDRDAPAAAAEGVGAPWRTIAALAPELFLIGFDFRHRCLTDTWNFFQGTFLHE